mmetsp:Transcript_8574/g.7604  ORF Transcript_8574/g.7604 Transcript_8574/m.7604 type:complete len:301 (+) Transcript_8574:281-1183(+)
MKVEYETQILEGYKTQLREASKTEVANQYGIMEKSPLICTVIEARNIKLLDYNSTADLYVVIECGDNSAQTKHIEGMQNPVWDETFQFTIHSGKEEIRLSVMDRNMMKKDSVVGVLYIPLQTLIDQQKVEDWFNLEDPQGGYGDSNGRIRLQLWWIHSKTKLIEDRIMQMEEDIEKIKSDKEYYQRYSDKAGQLREAFGVLEIEEEGPNRDSGSKGAYSNASFYHSGNYKDEEESDDEETLTNPIVKVTNKIFKPEKTLARGIESYSDSFSQGILGLRTTPWFRIMQWSAIIYYILTLCS